MPLNSCPHYQPAGLTGPHYLCRGCGALVANIHHPAVSQLGGYSGADLVLSSPEHAQDTRKGKLTLGLHA